MCACERQWASVYSNASPEQVLKDNKAMQSR